MCEYYSMPVGQIQYVALSLHDGNEKRCTEVIGIEKLGELSSPVCEGF